MGGTLFDLVFLGFHNFTTLIDPAFGADMVRQLGLAALGAFGDGNRLQFFVGPAHIPL
jgi:hypothetical protein